MITWTEYRKHNSRWWKARNVRLCSPIQNGYETFPVGTVFRITGKYKGFDLRQVKMCEHCGKGKISTISRVDPIYLNLVPQLLDGENVWPTGGQ